MSHLKKRKHPILHWSLLILGWVAVVLGVLGIFLPILPTTPFLLLAAACFARTSDRFYHWLVDHPRLGRYISAYIDGKGIPFKAKCYTSALIICMMSLSIWIVKPPVWVIVSMALIALCVSIYLFRLPTLDVQQNQSISDHTSKGNPTKPAPPSNQ